MVPGSESTGEGYLSVFTFYLCNMLVFFGTEKSRGLSMGVGSTAQRRVKHDFRAIPLNRSSIAHLLKLIKKILNPYEPLSLGSPELNSRTWHIVQTLFFFQYVPHFFVLV